MGRSSVKGWSETQAKLRELQQKARQAALAALYQRCCQIMAKSDSLVPVRYGRLRASHFVSLPNSSGLVVMGYGATYAIYVHEDLSAHHEHGQAKFLETALVSMKGDNAKWIKAKTIENLQKGVGLGGATLFPTAPQGGG